MTITRKNYNKIVSYIDRVFTYTDKDITSDSVWFWDHDEKDGSLIRYVTITKCKNSVHILIKNKKMNKKVEKFCQNFSEINDMKKIISLIG